MSKNELICCPKFWNSHPCYPIIFKVCRLNFVEFRDTILSFSYNHCAPNIICLQEIWRIHDCTMFNIEGYHPLVYKSRSNNVQGGGVGINVKKSFNFVINEVLPIFGDRILESIFYRSEI